MTTGHHLRRPVRPFRWGIMCFTFGWAGAGWLTSLRVAFWIEISVLAGSLIVIGGLSTTTRKKGSHADHH